MRKKSRLSLQFKVPKNQVVSRFINNEKRLKTSPHFIFDYGSNKADISVYIVTSLLNTYEEEKIWKQCKKCFACYEPWNNKTAENRFMARADLNVKDIENIECIEAVNGKENKYSLSVRQNILDKVKPHPSHAVITDSPNKRRSIELEILTKLYNISTIIYPKTNN